MKPHIEIVVEDVVGAQLAVQAGANSLELCASLDQGGLTAPYGLMKEVVDAAKKINPAVQVHMLILNKADGFYPRYEDVNIMIAEIENARKAKADGVVFGALRPDDTIAPEALRPLMEASKGLKTTFHRAFDRIRDQKEAVESLVAFEMDRILTSGRPGKAPEHGTHLRELVEIAAGRIQIVVGGGVRADNFQALARQTGATVMHMSCRKADKDATGLKPTDPQGLQKIMGLRDQLG